MHILWTVIITVSFIAFAIYSNLYSAVWAKEDEDFIRSKIAGLMWIIYIFTMYNLYHFLLTFV